MKACPSVRLHVLVVMVVLLLSGCRAVPSGSSPISSVAPTEPTPSPTATLAASLTPVPTLGGEYVGTILHSDVCLLLDTAAETYELLLPDRYHAEETPDGVQIVDSKGAIVAAPGAQVGVDGDVNPPGVGSFCMLGPILQVSEIVAVAPKAS